MEIAKADKYCNSAEWSFVNERNIDSLCFEEINIMDRKQKHCENE